MTSGANPACARPDFSLQDSASHRGVVMRLINVALREQYVMIKLSAHNQKMLLDMTIVTHAHLWLSISILVC